MLLAQHLGGRGPQPFEADLQPAPQLVAGHRGRRGEGRLLDQDAALAQVERVEEGRAGVAAGAVGIRRRPVHQRARPGRDGWAVEAGEEAERGLVGAWRTGLAQQPLPAAARRVDDQPHRHRTVVGQQQAAAPTEVLGADGRAHDGPTPGSPERVGEQLVQAGVVEDRVRARHLVLAVSDDPDRRPRRADDGPQADRFELVDPAAVRRRPDLAGRRGHQHGLDADLGQRGRGRPAGRAGPDDRDLRVEPRRRGRHPPSSTAMRRNSSTTFGGGRLGSSVR